MRVRPATPDDADVIAWLLGQLTSHERPAGVIAASIAYGGEQVLVAEEDADVVGVAAVHVHRMLHQTRPVARLTVLVVDEEHRRQGAGAALVEQATELARRAGCSGIELTTATHRQEAHRFYERRGFTATSLKFWRPIEP